MPTGLPNAQHEKPGFIPHAALPLRFRTPAVVQAGADRTSCCVSTLGCVQCTNTCSLTCEKCDARSPFQLFSYNASTGEVRVAAGGEPQCAKHGRPDLKAPFCLNLWGNHRAAGTKLDAYPCGYPKSDALLGPGTAAAAATAAFGDEGFVVLPELLGPEAAGVHSPSTPRPAPWLRRGTACCTVREASY